MSDATRKSRAPGTPVAESKSGPEIICGCFGFSQDNIVSMVQATPGQSFDDFLAASKAGSKCTACMLDLEYLFVEASRGRLTTDAAESTARKEQKRSLKQAVYDFLDGISPMTALPLTDFMPVLYGGSIQQKLWIANEPLLFKQGSEEPPFKVDIGIRDAGGALVYSDRHRVEPNSVLEFDVTKHLPKTEGLSVGALHVVRRSVRSGYRGTTRPQVEFIAPQAATVLHCQSAHGVYDKRFSFRPGADDRILFSVINCGNSSMGFELTCRRASKPDTVVDRKTVQLKPYGGAYLEPEISGADLAEDDLYVMHFRSNGYGKLHVICADKDLNRMSIDHL